MALQLSDLDELNKRTRSVSSRSHLNEAIIWHGSKTALFR